MHKREAGDTSRCKGAERTGKSNKTWTACQSAVCSAASLDRGLHDSRVELPWPVEACSVLGRDLGVVEWDEEGMGRRMRVAHVMSMAFTIHHRFELHAPRPTVLYNPPPLTVHATGSHIRGGAVGVSGALVQPHGSASQRAAGWQREGRQVSYHKAPPGHLSPPFPPSPPPPQLSLNPYHWHGKARRLARRAHQSRWAGRCEPTSISGFCHPAACRRRPAQHDSPRASQRKPSVSLCSTRRLSPGRGRIGCGRPPASPVRSRTRPSRARARFQSRTLSTDSTAVTTVTKAWRLQVWLCPPTRFPYFCVENEAKLHTRTPRPGRKASPQHQRDPDRGVRRRGPWHAQGNTLPVQPARVPKPALSARRCRSQRFESRKPP